jgi:hypothetical protein
MIARPHPLVHPDRPLHFCLKIINEMVPAEVLPGIGLVNDRFLPALAALHLSLSNQFWMMKDV